MAVTASMSILDGDYAPSADVLMVDSGQRFISVKLDDGYSSVILPGFDARSATYARALAAALHHAADQISAEPASAPDPVQAA